MFVPMVLRTDKVLGAISFARIALLSCALAITTIAVVTSLAAAQSYDRDTVIRDSARLDGMAERINTLERISNELHTQDSTLEIALNKEQMEIVELKSKMSLILWLLACIATSSGALVLKALSDLIPRLKPLPVENRRD